MNELKEQVRELQNCITEKDILIAQLEHDTQHLELQLDVAKAEMNLDEKDKEFLQAAVQHGADVSERGIRWDWHVWDARAGVQEAKQRLKKFEDGANGA